VIGYLLVVAAFALGAIDVYLTVSRDQLVITNLGELWHALSPQTLYLAEPAVSRYVGPAVWQNGVQLFLMLPSMLGLLIIGTLILLVAQLIYRPR
jgi:hypothetical protein